MRRRRRLERDYGSRRKTRGCVCMLRPVDFDRIVIATEETVREMIATALHAQFLSQVWRTGRQNRLATCGAADRPAVSILMVIGQSDFA